MIIDVFCGTVFPNCFFNHAPTLPKTPREASRENSAVNFRIRLFLAQTRIQLWTFVDAFIIADYSMICAWVAELVDARDLKSLDLTVIRVRLPSRAPKKTRGYAFNAYPLFLSCYPIATLTGEMERNSEQEMRTFFRSQRLQGVEIFSLKLKSTPLTQANSDVNFFKLSMLPHEIGKVGHLRHRVTDHPQKILSRTSCRL